MFQNFFVKRALKDSKLNEPQKKKRRILLLNRDPYNG